MQNIKLEKCWYSKDADEETDKNIDEYEVHIDYWYVLQYKLTRLLTVKNKDLKSDQRFVKVLCYKSKIQVNNSL